jgi:hypothetical protein
MPESISRAQALKILGIVLLVIFVDRSDARIEQNREAAQL